MFENYVKTCLFAERRCDLRLFPTVSPWTPLDLQKKTALRGNVFLRNAGFGLIMFPTVSDRFIFSERLIGPIPFMEG